jgi:hypothetical protein
MRRRFALTLTALAILIAAPASQGALRPARHTKRQAEVNILRVVASRWKVWRRSGLVNPGTHLLADNTEAVCSGRGRPQARRYERFLCVVRPHVHHGRQGLWLGYRALTTGRYKVRVLAYRRH